RVGAAAPRFIVDRLTGGVISSAGLRGKPAYINIFASWCPPCRQELPAVVGAYSKYRGAVAFLGVDEQEPAVAVRPFVKAMKLTFDVGLDRGQMAATYGASSIPESIFIDRRGVVRAIVHGPISSTTLANDLALIAGP
ncbi:MAG: TlpA family protein disulfide reductase, partial [Vulcanimicrobiaceae bacterium]